MTTAKMTVARFLAIKIDESEKTQKEIAAELGYEAPNIITMFKTGATKLPIAAIGSMARALNVDPVFLLRLAFREYYPDTFDAIEHALGSPVVTANERRFLELLRSSHRDSDPDLLLIEPRLVHGLAVVMRSSSTRAVESG